jgi:hypothetical protein
LGLIHFLSFLSDFTTTELVFGLYGLVITILVEVYILTVLWKIFMKKRKQLHQSMDYKPDSKSENSEGNNDCMIESGTSNKLR